MPGISGQEDQRTKAARQWLERIKAEGLVTPKLEWKMKHWPWKENDQEHEFSMALTARRIPHWRCMQDQKLGDYIIDRRTILLAVELKMKGQTGGAVGQLGDVPKNLDGPGGVRRIALSYEEAVDVISKTH